MATRKEALEGYAMTFLLAKKNRQRWSRIEDEAEAKMNKLIDKQVVAQTAGDHILTVLEWDQPRPTWEMRTWGNPRPTRRKVTFVCSCGQEIATVSPQRALSEVDAMLTRHLRRMVRKSLGVAQ